MNRRDFLEVMGAGLFGGIVAEGAWRFMTCFLQDHDDQIRRRDAELAALWDKFMAHLEEQRLA